MTHSINIKYRLGTEIKVKDKFNEYVEGHVVMWMNGYYYCSMYPGALPNYEYIHCIDLRMSVIDEEGGLYTLQPLNKFKEEELEFTNIKTERKEKLKKIENGE